MSDNLITFPGAKPPEARPPEARPADPPEAVLEPGADEAPPVVELAEPGTPRPEFLGSALEAVLFSLDRPAPLSELLDLLGEPLEGALLGSLESLKEGYVRRNAGIRLVEVAGGFQLRTVAQARPWVAAAQGAKPFRLSRAAVETLSIVAYRQPVTRADVEEIRGVDSGGMMRSLLEKRLLKLMGRKEEPGRPLLYGTSDDFLEIFGLKDLSDLPTLRDLRELERDDPRDGPVQLDFPDF
jgi:segregation and condensation protein B